MRSIRPIFTLCLFTFFTGSPFAFAQFRETMSRYGVFVEPAVTYEVSNSNANYAETGSANGDSDGFGIGARLGGHVLESAFIGLDGRYSFPRLSDRSGRTDAETYNLGPTVGLQTPVAGVRLWGTWIVDAAYDPQGTNGYNAIYENGDGYRLGVGVRMRSVSLNVEYQTLDFDTTKAVGVGGTDYSNTNFSSDSYVASLSFPYAF